MAKSKRTPQRKFKSPLCEGLLAGDRSALARAITFLESTAVKDLSAQRELLATLLPHCGKSLRLGITGVPGAGKSSLIDALGMEFVRLGKRVAVLAIDPSSSLSAGSILGDKTRMERLSREPNAFIRPSPSAGMLGGVAARTREAIIAVEAAGYDLVIVETVGVGQSEIAVRDLVDCCVLLLLSGAGDELQTMKRGLMELADLLVVNKCDGENAAAASRFALELRQTLKHLTSFTPGWSVPVLTASALRGGGISEIAEAITDFHAEMGRAGVLEARRRAQELMWFEERLSSELRRVLLGTASGKRRYLEVESQVRAGKLSPPQAVERLVGKLLSC